MGKIKFIATASSDFDSVDGGVDAIAHCKLVVEPDSAADLYLSKEGDETLEGCAAYLSTMNIGLVTMMHYMISKGWTDRETFLNVIMTTLTEVSAYPGSVPERGEPKNNSA